MNMAGVFRSNLLLFGMVRPLHRWHLMRSRFVGFLILVLAFLGADRSFAVDTFEDFATVEFAIPQGQARRVDDELVIRLDNTYYRVPYFLQEAHERANFDAMTEPMKAKFLMNRDLFFQNAAKVLHTLDWAIGIGSVTKEKILFFKRKEKTNEAFKERKSRIVMAILSGMNKQLWHDAPVVGNANEFALSASVGLGLEGGALKKGWGGQVDLGITMGVNKTQKAFVFQIFRNLEKFSSTLMPAMIYAGLVGKAGIQIIENTKGGIETRKGTTFYPPAAPGFLTETPSMASSGVSSGIGFPPPPIADLLTFTNELDHKALLRVVVSPTLKGFVRVYIGLDLKSIGVVLAPIRLLIDSIQYRLATPSCHRIY